MPPSSPEPPPFALQWPLSPEHSSSWQGQVASSPRQLNPWAKSFQSATSKSKQMLPKPPILPPSNNTTAPSPEEPPAQEALPAPKKRPGPGTQGSLDSITRGTKGNIHIQMPPWGPQRLLPWNHGTRMALQSSFQYVFCIWIPSVGSTYTHEGGEESFFNITRKSYTLDNLTPWEPLSKPT